MHYFRFNIGDYHKKAGRLSMIEHGAYTLLLHACYDRETFPTEQDALDWCWARTPEEIAAVKFVLSKFFVLQDGVFVQSRVAEEIATFRAKSDTNRAIAKEREERKRTNRARDDQERAPNHITNNQLTTSQLINNQEPKNKTARGTRLPADVELSQSWIEFCRQERPDLLPSQVFAQFRDYWIAQPGAKGTKLDWDATWRNWVRNQKGGQKKEGDRKMDLLLGRRKPDVIDMDFGGPVDVIG